MANHLRKNGVLESIYNSIINGDASATTVGVQKALKAEHSPSTILNDALISAMEEVGLRFKAQEFYVPEMLIAARAMKSGLSVLKPHLIEAGIEPVGKVVLGSVKGDLHDIGKNLVAMMLEGSGFEVLDLGVDVPPEKFVYAVREHTPRFVGMSALLTTTMPQMQTTIKALKEVGLRDQVIVMVGGAPLSQQFADGVGADLYAPDAATAANLARILMNGG